MLYVAPSGLRRGQDEVRCSNLHLRHPNPEYLPEPRRVTRCVDFVQSVPYPSHPSFRGFRIRPLSVYVRASVLISTSPFFASQGLKLTAALFHDKANTAVQVLMSGGQFLRRRPRLIPMQLFRTLKAPNEFLPHYDKFQKRIDQLTALRTSRVFFHVVRGRPPKQLEGWHSRLQRRSSETNAKLARLASGTGLGALPAVWLRGLRPL